MKSILLPLLVLISGIIQAQTTWKPLPLNPPAPTAGQIGAKSADILIDENSGIYMPYLYDNGANIVLNVDRFVPGSGWSTIYSDFAYSGFESIRSFTIGTDLYFSCKIDDGSANPVFRVYRIQNQAVGIAGSAAISDIVNETDYSFTVSDDGQYAYILAPNTSNSNLLVHQLDLVSNTLISSTIPLGGFPFASYELIAKNNQIFVSLVAGSASTDVYLFKSPTGSMSFSSFNISTSSSGIISGLNSTNPYQLLMSFDAILNEVILSSKGNTQNFETRYNLASTNLTIGSAPLVGIDPFKSVNRFDGTNSYYFGNFNGTASATANTFLIQTPNNTTVPDTIGDASTELFGGIATSATDHRMNISQNNKRFVSGFYNSALANRQQFVTNNAPEYLIDSTVQNPLICPNTFNTIFNSVSIKDINLDQISIVSIASSDNSVINSANVYGTIIGSNNGIVNFDINGTVEGAGSCFLIVTVTDYWDTIVFTLPQTTIASIPLSSFTDTLISICSQNGIVDLNGYLNQTAVSGSFSIPGLEINFVEGLVNTNSLSMAYNTPNLLTYSYFSGGCYLTSTTQIIAFESPSVSLTAIPTTCGQSSGSATAIVTGGTTPYIVLQWSSGEQNTTSVTNLSAGLHTFLVKDLNSCQIIESFNIATTGSDATAVIQPPSCFGQLNGSIAATPIGLIAPLTYLWSSGHSTPTISNIGAGNYTLTVTDASNCVLTKTFEVTQPEPLTGYYGQINPSCGFNDGQAHVDSIIGGTSPYSYSWSNAITTPTNINLGFGIYSVTVEDANGCQTIHPFYLSEMNGAELYSTITPTNCGSSTGAIDVIVYVPTGDPVTSVSWSNGETTEDISNLPANTYVCTLTLANTCRAIKGWNIPIVEPMNQPICVVTVDSSTTTNLVVWEPVQPIGIAYYTIYRETSNQGEYILIDTVNSSNLTLFNDVVASPSDRSWSYKISAVNGCGVEGPLSLPHRTMHLSLIDNGPNVIVSWNAYEGTDFANYIVSRYTDATGWQIAGVVSNTTLSFDDAVLFSTPGLDYLVEIDLSSTCTAITYRAQDFNTVRSNKDKGGFVAGNGTGDSNNSIDESYLQTIGVYPNPTSGNSVLSQTSNEFIYIRIRDLRGTETLSVSGNASEITIPLTTIAQGTYLMDIQLNDSKITRTIIKL